MVAMSGSRAANSNHSFCTIQKNERDETMYNKIKTINWKQTIIVVIIILLLELFVWNHSFWITSGYHPIHVDEIYTETGAPLNVDSEYVIVDNSYLEIRNINQPIKNVYLDIWTTKEKERDVLTLKLHLLDEGSKNYYSSNNKVISSFLSKCNYISVYPYGDLKALKLTFPNEKGTTIEVKNIVLNQPVPMFFSLERLLVMCFLYFIIRTLFFLPYDVYYQPDSKKQKLTSGLLLLLSIAIVFPLTLIGNDRNGLATMDKYTDLTHALANGALYVDDDVDERLLSAENPYDRAERRDLGIGGYKWDYAYYNGKIYVYFGITPVILTYLPYYFITDTDLAHEVPYMIFLISLMIGSFLLIDVLVKKYSTKMPLKLFYLFQVTFMLGIGTLIFAKRVCIYNMAIMAAVDFTVWGLYFWLNYSIELEKRKSWMVPIGSLCMALVAGCRPQLLMASFLAIPIFAQQWNSICKDISQKKKIGRHIFLFTAFCLPYIIVAAFLMWYNAARFGSPFDFGSAYNLTTNDMTKRGFHFARFIPGIWSFLFQPASLGIEFPYIGITPFQTAYQGRTIHEAGIGGIFVTNVILLPCFLFYHYRAKLKQKKAFLFTGISLAGAFVIVCADVQLAGILTRYIADFSILFYLAAFTIIFTWIDEYYTLKNASAHKTPEITWCRIIALLCCITILYLVLSVFALYVAGDYDAYRPVWYYHMKELWGLFDV